MPGTHSTEYYWVVDGVPRPSSRVVVATGNSPLTPLTAATTDVAPHRRSPGLGVPDHRRRGFGRASARLGWGFGGAPAGLRRGFGGALAGLRRTGAARLRRGSGEAPADGCGVRSAASWLTRCASCAPLPQPTPSGCPALDVVQPPSGCPALDVVHPPSGCPSLGVVQPPSGCPALGVVQPPSGCPVLGVVQPPRGARPWVWSNPLGMPGPGCGRTASAVCPGTLREPSWTRHDRGCGNGAQ